MPSDFSETIRHLSQERYRAIIIHTAPDKSSELSLFLKKAAVNFDGNYLNLLDLFVQSLEMSKDIDSFSLEDLQHLLIQESKDHSLILLDQSDFLLDSWRKPVRKDFFRFLTNQWDGYKQGMKTILIVGLQTSGEIESLNLPDSKERSRVFPLTSFNDIL